MLLSEIAKAIDAKLVGNGDCEITSVKTIESAQKGSIVFAFEKKYLKNINSCPASAFVVASEIKELKNQLIVANPRKSIAQILHLFFPRQKPIPVISDKADIDETAVVGRDVSVGAFSVIGANAHIGDGTVILDNVSVGKNVKVGKNCVLYPQVVLYDNVELGDNVILHAGTKVGIDGYGYYPKGENWMKIPQVGKVVIGNEVEIGGNVCIDRGCIGDTVIGDGTKIDNLVHLAHNCVIGKNCAITGLVGFAGGVVFEDHVMVAGQSGFNGYITVGKNTTVLGKSGVTKDTEPNSIVSGYPAQDNRTELSEKATLKRIIKEYKKK